MRRGRVAVVAATMVVLTACSGNAGGSSSSAATAAADPAKVAGEITVLTNRTDQVADGSLKKYADESTRVHPNVTVKFEGLTDYEGEVKIRMNTENYGDVLLIPDNLSITRYPTFFAPLGDSAELSRTYDWTDYATVKDKVYGIADYGTATGLVYNKAVWQQAGVTRWPMSTQEFIDDLKAIKAKGTATPYYTNYKDAWPLQKWTDDIGGPSCDQGGKDKLSTTAQPWAAGQDLNAIDGLLYDTVHQKLSEDDPTTTNWEGSKTLLGTGRIGAMLLGSWAVPQMQAAAIAAGRNPDDIGFMPFPQATGGKLCTIIQPDYKYAVNVHSKNKEAARAWIDWYLTKSGSAQAEQAVSSVKGSPLPASLKPFEAQGVTLLPGQNQVNAAVISKIDKNSEIGLGSPDYRQKLVDIARGAAPGDHDSYFAELNEKWSEAQKTVTG
ncbi:sugar ABC transporter substrate-binding protein [Kitasatospora herbaricolor]|uniref:ABC transporter substrate-binding protein n=1 Tax=Kitasatospora herbaricolor TaxID=68217 RepID=UPI00174EAE31|nr:extracellular solute-binding protein [Kitasatospora herbaricolor]MDQ0306758.1 ABC-type glycerol-3-phosphate transport system substrate-binding protein [Kitasatospora herbaricolor]GGV44441.1 sugar ABC transporter substrate-binding protein [Kitasatospora herbaricolor]